MYFAKFRGWYKQGIDQVHREEEARLRDQEAQRQTQEDANAAGDESSEQRRKSLPQLTPEQHEQMQKYLKLVQAHGVRKMQQLQSSAGCIGCPALDATGKVLSRQSQTQTPERNTEKDAAPSACPHATSKLSEAS